MKRRFVLWIAILSMFFAACSGAEERTAASAETVSSAAEQDGQETVSAAAETTAPSESAAKPDQEAVRRAIQDFCEMLYGTLKYDSTVTFGWDDFDSIEGYMIAKCIETQRECNKIDGEEVTEIRVKPAKLVGETLEQDGGYIQCAITATEYVWGGETGEVNTRYFFTLRERDGSLRVTDLTTYNPAYTITESDDLDIAVLRDSLDSWKEECKDAGDKWQFEAVDRIMEKRKVPIDDLIPDELKEEMERRRKKTAEDAAVVVIRFNEAYERPESPLGSGMTFQEGDTSFWVSFTYLDLYDVYFSDDSIKTVGEALELGLIGMADLDRFEIPYVKGPGDAPETSGEPDGRETEAASKTPDGRETVSSAAEPDGRETAAETSAPDGRETETTKAAGAGGEGKESGISRYYSEADIDQAKEAVRGWMSEAFEEGAKLKELYYPGDDFTDEFADSGATAFRSTDNSMVLGGYFIQSDGTERGTSGYPLWVWILWRSSDGGWFVKDAGY